jgi:hypothetical protein
MSYGKGRFSNLDLPDPTLSYVARKAFTHHDLTFAPGDPVRVEQVGSAKHLQYVRTRLVVLPVAPGDAVPPEAGAALLAERQPKDVAPAAPKPAAPEETVLIEKPAPAATELEEALANPIKPAPKPAKLTADDLEGMSKAELLELAEKRGLGGDSRLPIAALRARIAHALKL